MIQNCQDHFLEMGEVEKHPAWQGKISHAEISLLLTHESPYTYVLSGSGPADYWVSYVRAKNLGIAHVHFAQILVKEGETIRKMFRNVVTTIFYTPESLIRYKLKGRGIPFKRFSLQMSA